MVFLSVFDHTQAQDVAKFSPAVGRFEFSARGVFLLLKRRRTSDNQESLLW